MKVSLCRIQRLKCNGHEHCCSFKLHDCSQTCSQRICCAPILARIFSVKKTRRSFQMQSNYGTKWLAPNSKLVVCLHGLRQKHFNWFFGSEKEKCLVLVKCLLKLNNVAVVCSVKVSLSMQWIIHSFFSLLGNILTFANWQWLCRKCLLPFSIFNF